MIESGTSGRSYRPDIPYAVEAVQKYFWRIAEWYSPLHAPQKYFDAWVSILEAQSAFFASLREVSDLREQRSRKASDWEDDGHLVE